MQKLWKNKMAWKSFLGLSLISLFVFFFLSLSGAYDTPSSPNKMALWLILFLLSVCGFFFCALQLSNIKKEEKRKKWTGEEGEKKT